MNQQLRKIQQFFGVFYIPLLLVLMTLALFALGYSHVQPKQYHFELNQVAQETVQAPVTIEDTEQTELNRQRARDNVVDQYVFQPAVETEQVSQAQAFFDFVKEVTLKTYPTVSSGSDSQLLTDERDDQSESGNESTASSADIVNKEVHFSQLPRESQDVIWQAALESIPQPLSPLADRLSESDLTVLFMASEENLNSLASQLTDVLSTNLSREIESSDLATVRENAQNQLSQAGLNYSDRTLLTDLLNEFIIPTVVYSESETDKRREEAAAAVQPAYILQGQIIVQAGHIIDQETYRRLDLFGYLDRQSNADLFILFAITLVLHVAFLVYLLMSQDPEALKAVQSKMAVTAYCILFVVSLALLKVLALLQMNGIDYAMALFPIYMAPLFLKPRTNLSLTVFFMSFFNLFAIFITNEAGSRTVTFIIIAFYLLSSLLALNYLLIRTEKELLRKAFLFALVTHTVFMVPLVIIINLSLLSELSLTFLAFVLFNLFIGFGIYFFVEPYWHKLLSSQAPLTLNQLASLNHPLLKEIVEKAPGTYQHSMMVANMSAAASDAIGANTQLVRIASYYHDVGKSLHPLFFIENLTQGMASPHQVMKPIESAEVIIGHVTEGEKLLRRYDMPQSVIDICLQHHGTTTVGYFLHQARQEDPTVDVSLFTYPGPKPQTKEAMTIMLADSIEAASRTLKSHTQADFEKLVDDIIKGKEAEGQFEECDLKVYELALIRKALIQSVASMYHTRIEYPD